MVIKMMGNRRVQTSAATPPESTAECAPFAEQVLSKSCIGNADGCQGLQKAIRGAIGVSTKAAHHKLHYTLTVVIKKKDCSKAQLRTLSDMVKAGSAIEQVHQFKVVGGDQKTESQIGHLKNTLRRQGKLGRRTKHDTSILSAQFLLETPGLDAMLDAISAYRVACRSCDPDEAFQSHVQEWLSEV